MVIASPLIPDFDDILVQEVQLPYRQSPYLRFTYHDPMLEGFEATVVEDTIANIGQKGEGQRVFTIIVRFPRPILPEVNTHRTFSRNSASSRARSVKTTIGDVMQRPHIPLFTRNQKGMSGVFLSAEERKRAVEKWLVWRDVCVEQVLDFLLDGMMPWEESTGLGSLASRYSELLDLYYEEVYNAKNPNPLALSIHKQDVNRILEPVMMHEVIITATYWENFLKLRTDLNTAQPAIVALAKLVEKALNVSVPRVSWLHLPFIDYDEVPTNVSCFADLRNVAMLSATESAQISYNDKSRASKSTATIRLGERLFDNKHFSPFEHMAFSVTGANDIGLNAKELAHSNFGPDWVQLRHILEQETRQIENSA